MKKISLLSLVAGFLFFASSCKKDDDHAHVDDCHECHIAYMLSNNTEIEVLITSPDGDDEWCGDELETAESSDFTYTLTEDVIVGTDTIPAGTYGPGANGGEGNMEICCEEHGHDH